ncbi:uncharacterized protein [Amphiura filiformis]|uniref:uncharacterized protein n=1 Tax=Amphiura filiformis TaxID=82378 RepID=UPI003B21FA0B
MAKIHAPIAINGNVPKTKDSDDVNLRYELRHLLRVMAVFGLYFTPKSWQASNHKMRYKSFLYPAHRLYCLFVLILLLLNGIKSFVGIWYIDDNFIAIQIILCGYWLQCSVNCCIWVYICYTDQLPNIFRFWQQYCQSSPESKMYHTALSVTCVRRRIRIITYTSVAFSVFSSFLPIAARFGPFESFRNDTNFMIAPVVDPIIVTNLELVIAANYSNAAFALPTSFLLIICTILSCQFKKFTDYFAKCMQGENRFKQCLIKLRLQHQYLSKAVFLVDEAFCFYLAVTFGSSILLACFQMYQLVVVKSFSSVITTLMTIFWFCMVSIQFSLVGVLTAQVHEKAHSIANHIHDICVFGFTTHEEVTQMNMFMAKLNGSPIAFTLWNILPLTKEFLLTVVGVYITYFALVAQSF